MLPMTSQSASGNHRASWAVEPFRWYVINTYPNAEFEVFASLGSFRRYLPTIVQRRPVLRHGHRGPQVTKNSKAVTKEVIRPYFPGYLFVELDLSDPSWGAIRHSTRGVKRFLTGADSQRPLPVPLGKIEGYMTMGRAGDGAIDPEIVPEFPALSPGQAVDVSVNGAEIRTTVHMTDQERVWVMMRWFDRDVPTEVPRASVRAV
jgi:transcriptional antiterminator NusG